ncbi:MAG: hypothetical protein RXO43_02585, partial [Candidatus Micrarchaeota archaeon]
DGKVQARFLLSTTEKVQSIEDLTAQINKAIEATKLDPEEVASAMLSNMRQGMTEEEYYQAVKDALQQQIINHATASNFPEVIAKEGATVQPPAPEDVGDAIRKAFIDLNNLYFAPATSEGMPQVYNYLGVRPLFVEEESSAAQAGKEVGIVSSYMSKGDFYGFKDFINDAKENGGNIDWDQLNRLVNELNDRLHQIADMHLDPVTKGQVISELLNDPRYAPLYDAYAVYNLKADSIDSPVINSIRHAFFGQGETEVTSVAKAGLNPLYDIEKQEVTSYPLITEEPNVGMFKGVPYLEDIFPTVRFGSQTFVTMSTPELSEMEKNIVNRFDNSGSFSLTPEERAAMYPSIIKQALADAIDNEEEAMLIEGEQAYSSSIAPYYESSIMPVAPLYSLRTLPNRESTASILPSSSTSIFPSISISPSPPLGHSISPSVSLSTPASSIPTSVSSSSISPSISLSISPAISPSVLPSASPSISPSESPSISPSVSPSISSSVSPSVSTSTSPSISLEPPYKKPIELPWIPPWWYETTQGKSIVKPLSFESVYSPSLIPLMLPETEAMAEQTYSPLTATAGFRPLRNPEPQGKALTLGTEPISMQYSPLVSTVPDPEAIARAISLAQRFNAQNNLVLPKGVSQAPLNPFEQAEANRLESALKGIQGKANEIKNRLLGRGNTGATLSSPAVFGGVSNVGGLTSVNGISLVPTAYDLLQVLGPDKLFAYLNQINPFKYNSQTLMNLQPAQLLREIQSLPYDVLLQIYNMLPMYTKAQVLMLEGIPPGEALSIAQLGALGLGVPPQLGFVGQNEKKLRQNIARGEVKV